MRAHYATDRWKLCLEDYLESAGELYRSMVRGGFDPAHPVPIDPNGDLLNGSHRVACALALGIGEVPVSREERYVWAPPWGEQWFIKKGMEAEDLDRLRRDVELLRRDCFHD
jgi:hypothetical protein